MTRSRSSRFKLTSIAALLLTLTTTVGCAMPREERVAYAAPALIEMSPGVWGVEDYPGYYYANGGYWYFADDGVWYQRPYWGGPWASVEVRSVPRGISGRPGFIQHHGFSPSERSLHAEYSPSAPHTSMAAPRASGFEHHR